MDLQSPTIRRLVRLAFRDRMIAIRGEADRPFHFRPAEHPGFLRGTRRVEAEIRRQWQALLGEDETIFDVGANIGFTVQRFCALQGGRCRVWAFEPLARNAGVLRENVRELGGDIVVVEAAVGNHDGQATFEDNVAHGALSHLAAVEGLKRPDALWKERREIVVPVIRLDTYCRQHPEARPTFLKIDVEGAGHWVMEGARETLAAGMPAISCSYHTRDESAGVEGVARELGYRGVDVGPDGGLFWSEGSRWGNFIHPDSARAARVRG